MPVGVGTALLCSLRPGESFDAVGPLGRRMDEGLPDGRARVRRRRLRHRALHLPAGRVAPRAATRARRERTVIFGARTAERLSLHGRLPARAARVELCTDDGSRGFHGRVDARLDALLRASARPRRWCSPAAPSA